MRFIMHVEHERTPTCSPGTPAPRRIIPFRKNYVRRNPGRPKRCRPPMATLQFRIGITPVRAHLRQAMTSSSYAGNPRFGYLMIWQTSTLDWTTGWRCEDADGGDDCTRSTGACEGQERSGDCPVAEVAVGNGGQVFALGRDCTAVRAAGSALSTAGGIPEGSGAAGGGER